MNVNKMLQCQPELQRLKKISAQNTVMGHD